MFRALASVRERRFSPRDAQSTRPWEGGAVRDRTGLMDRWAALVGRNGVGQIPLI